MHIDENYKYRSMLGRALYDPGYKLIVRFLVEVPDYLKNVAQVLLGFVGSGFWRARKTEQDLSEN